MPIEHTPDPPEGIDLSKVLVRAKPMASDFPTESLTKRRSWWRRLWRA